MRAMSKNCQVFGSAVKISHTSIQITKISYAKKVLFCLRGLDKWFLAAALSVAYMIVKLSFSFFFNPLTELYNCFR